MLIPTKHESLKRNLLVIGAEILRALKEKEMDIEELFQIVKKELSAGLNDYHNAITFLWSAELLDVHEHRIFIKKNNDIA